MNSTKGDDRTETQRCGFIALVGRPNVGKSTLLNHLLQQKISITSRKPQTTRHRIVGIRTTENTQYVYVDTPGLHKERKKPLNRLMNETVDRVIQDVDLVIFMVERLAWTDEDELVLKALENVGKPILLVINKCDLLSEQNQLLPHIDFLSKKRAFTEIIPVSALKRNNLEVFDDVVKKHLPVGDFLYPEDQVTDRSSRFIAAEIIREKITRQLGDELPYEVTVEIEKFSDEENIIHIHGLILVEKKGQKHILIGKNGERLKSIGSAARVDMEKLFAKKVMLKLWVKVKSGWGDNERALQSLGYTDF
jgi:GTP-binding protein Era